MLTGQKYGEGDSLANNVEQSAKNPDSTANSANQTVSTDTPTAFSYTDLLLFAHLTDSDKILLSGLRDQGISDTKLAKALRHMVKTPSDSAPSDKFDGVSLSDILSEPETTLSDFLKTPELSEFNRSLLISLLENGASNELVLKTGQRLHEHFPTQVPTETKKFEQIKGQLVDGLSLSVNSRFGNSRTDVLLFALSEYRDHRLKEAFEEIRSGEYNNGYTAFQDSEEAASCILEIGLELGALADKNYWATHNEPAKVIDHNRDGFERFMREYIGREATDLD